MTIGILLILASGRATLAATFDVRQFGAVSDGKTMNTAAFARAIDACRQASGGTVNVSAGTWLTGPIDFVNGMTLHLEKGAVLLLSTASDDYPIVETRWEGVICQARRPCVWANGCKDVGITGEGAIDGQGAGWWEPILTEKKSRKNEPAAPAAIDPRTRRPMFVQFRNCQNVTIDGITLRNSPMWTLHLLLSDQITVRGARFINPANSPNTDAVDVDSCRHVLIEDCSADVGDDAFCLKSGKDEDGRRLNRPTEDVTVRRCKVAHAHGGVVIGSETAGSIRNVKFEDCQFNGTSAGIRIKSMRGRGGVVENVQAKNIAMNDVGNAIIITMLYKKTPVEKVSQRTPVFRDIHIKGVTVHGAKVACIIAGLEEMPIAAITLEDLDLTAQKGIECNWGKNIEFRNVKVKVDSGPAFKQENSQDVRLVEFHESKAP